MYDSFQNTFDFLINNSDCRTTKTKVKVLSVVSGRNCIAYNKLQDLFVFANFTIYAERSAALS